MIDLDIPFENLVKDYYARLDGKVFKGDKSDTPFNLFANALLNRDSDTQLEDAKRSALKIKERYSFSLKEFRLCMKDLTAFFVGEYLSDLEYAFQVYSYAVNENEVEEEFYKDIKEISIRIDYEEYLDKLLSHSLEERLEILGYGYLVMCYNDELSVKEQIIIEKLLER